MPLEITIIGSNFDSDFLEVKVDEEIQNIKFSDSSIVKFDYLNNSPGLKNISIETSSGKTIRKNSFFNFASPNISNISPHSISQFGGTSITITGSDLDIFENVQLGETNCAILEKTYNSLIFTSPAFEDDGHKNLTLSGPFQTIVETNIIEVISEPEISSFFPNILNPTKVESVKVFGKNLLNLKNLLNSSDESNIEFLAYNNFSGEANIYPNLSGQGNQTIQSESSIGTVLDTQNIYSYNTPNPVILKIEPSVLPSYSLSINESGQIYKSDSSGIIYGNYFLPPLSVKIGGQNVKIITGSSLNTNSSIPVILPTGLIGYSDIEITSNGRTSTLNSGTNFSNLPIFEKVYPDYSWSGGGQMITIEGQNLLGSEIFIEQGTNLNPTFAKIENTKINSDQKLSFFTIPGSGGCRGQYMGTCLDPKGQDGPRIIKISGRGGDFLYSGLNYVNEPKIISAYQTGFDTIWGALPSNTIFLNGKINVNYDPSTWNSFNGKSVKFYPGNSGAFSQSVSPKINGVKLQILTDQSSATGLACKIPYLKYSLSGSNKTVLGFSGNTQITVSSGLSAELLNKSSFIDSLEDFNSSQVFVDKYLAYKIWYHNGVSEKDHSIDDWYDTSYSFDGWNKYGQGNPTPQPAQLKKIKPLEYVKKAKVRLDNGTNYQVGPGYLAGISTPNVLSFSLPSNAKIGTLIRVEIGQLGYNCTTTIPGFLEVDCDGCMYPGNGPARPNAKEKGPFTFLKTKNGWNIIHIGNYQTINSALNTGVSPGWIISPEVGELNFSWVKRKDSFDNAYFGNYIPNTISQNSSGNIHIEEKTNEIVNSGIFDSYNVLQVKSDDYLLNHEQYISFLPFVPPYIGAISTRSTGSSNDPSPNYGPLTLGNIASGVNNGGYIIDLSGFFQKTAGTSEVFIGEQKVAQIDSTSFGGTLPSASSSQNLISIGVTGFSLEQVGTFDVTIKNNLGQSTLPNAFAVFESPQQGNTKIQSLSITLSAPTTQNPAIYPKSIDLNQDNIPDSWDNQYFPNALNFTSFTITGFSNAPGGTSTLNSPNAVYLKTPSNQSTYPQGQGIYYYESGRQINSKGPNFILCAEGKCTLFLAPKNVIPYTTLPYDPVSSPLGALSFLKTFGKEFAPLPWNREWKYEQPQVGYSSGTVSPIFTSPINHYVLDSDADGLTNTKEYVFGTSPISSASKYAPSYSISGGMFHFFVPTIVDRKYTIQTGNLINWYNVATLTGDGFTKKFSTNTVGNIFFRAFVELLYKPPTVNEIFPNQAKLNGNENFIISGSNFSTVNALTVENTNVSNFQIESDSIIAFNPPNLSTSGYKKITITNKSGTTSGNGKGITYFNTPIVNSIIPNKFSAAGGSATISGSGFCSPISIAIENENNPTFSSINLTGLNISIPAQKTIGIKNLTVSTPGGSSNLPIEICGAPNIIDIDPNRGSPAGGNKITINGNNFISGYTKLFIEKTNGDFQEIAITDFLGTSSISATVPSSEISAPFSEGYRDIKVETFGGINSSLQSNGYYYVGNALLSSINPSTGNIDGLNNILISGSNLNSDTNIFIDGQQILNKVFISSSSISGKAPIGLTTGFKTVMSSGLNQGKSFLISGYRYAKNPIINTISTSCIKTGTSPNIKISGQNLLSSLKTKLTIGGQNSNISSNISETGIESSIPISNNPGPVTLFIDTEAGRSNSLIINYIGTPSSLSINPNWASETGKNNITIYGNNFGTGDCKPLLKVGTQQAQATSYTNSEIIFNAPASTYGAKNINVENLAGTGTVQFTYLMKPTIASVTPSEGVANGGNVVIISGSGILTSPFEGTKVYFNNSEIATSNLIGNVNSSSRVQFTVPARVGSENYIDLEIRNGGGQTLVKSGYKYIDAPIIASLLPSAGSIAGGNTFEISGSNITNDISVKFGNNTVGNLTFISNTGIRGSVPSSTNAAISNVTINGLNLSTVTKNYAYLDSPSIASITPSVGPSDYNRISFQISGSKFTLPNSNINYGSSLKIGSQEILINSISENIVNASITNSTTPSGVKNVQFSNLGGTGILNSGYTGINYFPTYSTPSLTENSTLLTASPTVNTLYITYQP